MVNVSIAPYGEYSGNGRANAITVNIGDVRLYFSYRTVVAFTTPQTGLVVSENNWSTTTGKHLNWINPNKKFRLKYDDFQKLLTKTLAKYKIEV
jgi:hypothetical protein